MPTEPNRDLALATLRQMAHDATDAALDAGVAHYSSPPGTDERRVAMSAYLAALSDGADVRMAHSSAATYLSEPFATPCYDPGLEADRVRLRADYLARIERATPMPPAHVHAYVLESFPPRCVCGPTPLTSRPATRCRRRGRVAAAARLTMSGSGARPASSAPPWAKGGAE